MKILVTGGCGYLGTVLVRTLLKEGFEVYIVDNFSQEGTALSLLGTIADYSNLHVINADILDIQLYDTIARQCDYILPLAAIVGFPLSERYPGMTYAINRDGVERLALACLNNCSARFIFPTTNSAYGTQPGICTENTPMNPLSTYAKSKVYTEKLLQLVLPKERLVCFRLATLFGPSRRMRLDLLVNNFAWRAYKESYIQMYEPGVKRNFLHVQDAADAFLFAIRNWDKVQGESFNLGNDSLNMTKLELAKTIKTFIPVEIIIGENGKDPDKRDYMISSDKLYKAGYTATRTIADTIPTLLNTFVLLDTPHHGNY